MSGEAREGQQISRRGFVKGTVGLGVRAATVPVRLPVKAGVELGKLALGGPKRRAFVAGGTAIETGHQALEGDIPTDLNEAQDTAKKIGETIKKHVPGLVDSAVDRGGDAFSGLKEFAEDKRADTNSGQEQAQKPATQESRLAQPTPTIRSEPTGTSTETKETPTPEAKTPNPENTSPTTIETATASTPTPTAPPEPALPQTNSPEMYEGIALPDELTKRFDVMTQPRYYSEALIDPSELSILNEAGDQETDPQRLLEGIERLARRYEQAVSAMIKQLNAHYKLGLNEDYQTPLRAPLWTQFLDNVTTPEQLAERAKQFLTNPDDLVPWMTGTLPQRDTSEHNPTFITSNPLQLPLEEAYREIYNSIFTDERDRVTFVRLKDNTPDEEGTIRHSTANGEITMDTLSLGDAAKPISYMDIHKWVHELWHAGGAGYDLSRQDSGKVEIDIRRGSLPSLLVQVALIFETFAKPEVFEVIKERFLNRDENHYNLTRINEMREEGVRITGEEWAAEIVGDLVGTEKPVDGTPRSVPIDQWPQELVNLVSILGNRLRQGEKSKYQPGDIHKDFTSMDQDQNDPSIRRDTVEGYVDYFEEMAV